MVPFETTQLFTNFLYGSCSEKGIRAENQDSLLSLSDQCAHTFAIADGAGGHEFGGKASKATILAIQNELETNDDYSLNYLYLLIQQKYQQINTYIYEYGKKINATLVTTLSMLNFVGNNVIVSNVGDTKIYRIRQGQIKVISELHTLAMYQLKNKEITEEEYIHHPQKHILTEAIGGSASVNPYFAVEPFYSGDVYLICTDGVYNFVSDDLLLKAFSSYSIRTNEDLDQICRDVVKMGLENNSSDNLSITAVIAY